MIDLDAIGARNDERKASVADKNHTRWSEELNEWQAVEDIDALLAEVERLNRIVVIDAAQRECDRKTHEGRVAAIVGGISDGLAGKHTGPALAAKIRKLNGGKGEK